ncbi:MAG: hypothetical protein ACE5IC_00070 [Candidatus Brocadiales bacterium]
MKEKKATRKVEKVKLGINIEQEAVIKLEEIKLAYLRQGKKVKIGQIVKEALDKLWQEVCKK